MTWTITYGNRSEYKFLDLQIDIENNLYSWKFAIN